ncbi:MAG TPA: phosphoglucosamine mutase, partial [Armatimonadota bacterium]|nr:phosphoglucosamine mutase [Armatimonadota bacterium]
MSRPLTISVGGVRGVVGETLTPELLTNFSQAFGTYIGPGRVLVSRDTRPSGPMVAPCVFAGVVATGCEVINLGVVPTAALQLAVKDSDAVGGIAITAGHNSEEWNALKFIRSDGIFLNHHQAGELLNVYHQKRFTNATWDRLEPIGVDAEAGERHLEAIRSQLDVAAIRAAGLKIALDCTNGACSRFTPRFLESLGCEVFAMNDDPELAFPHEPRPVPANLSPLQALVRAAGADAGFAHDADGDRLGIVTEKGEAPGEEYTICLATEMVLGRGDPGPVVTNLSTTMRVEEVAARHGREVLRTRVGQVFIAEAAYNHSAAIAGEGSGGVVFPAINYAHDSIAALAHIIQLMATRGAKLSKLVDDVPHYYMVKLTVPCPPQEAFSVLQELRRDLDGAWIEEVNLDDGIKLIGADRWVHIRV